MVHQNLVTITDRNYRDYTHPYNREGVSSSGYMPKPTDWEDGVSAAFPRELLVPEVEWAERYAEMKAKGLLLSEMCKRAVTDPQLLVRWLNQNPTNYCWCYAVVHMIMIMLLYKNVPYRRLVPASVAAPIKNYRNVGGWGSQALEFIMREGVADEEHWPQPTAMAAITDKYYESSRANAAETKVHTFYKVNTFEEKMSCMFRYMPVACGYGWMGHEMCSIDPYRSERGEWGAVDMDSYADKNGMFNSRAIVGRKSVGDDMVAALTSSSIDTL